MYTLVDTHCHLDFDQFDSDRGQVIDRAIESGVERIIVPAIDLDNCNQVLDLSEKYDCVYAALGIHPNSTANWHAHWLNDLRAMASDDRVVAIGEIGLDYYRDWSPSSIQKQAFYAQIELAIELDLPIIIHNRQADADILEFLTSFKAGDDRLRGVLHSFSASASLAMKALQMGFYIGFTGPLTFPKADELRMIARSAELNQVLIETDAPFLAPQAHRGRRNEPSYVRFVAAKLAEIREISIDEIAQITTANAYRLFKLTAAKSK